jgi:hypothetical protein
MIVNNLRLIILCIILLFAQFLINNLTIFYIDILAIVLVCLLMGGTYSWTQLIILSLVADLFGHWYLGSHLLTITILSVFSAKFTNFYRVSNWLPRTIMANLLFSILIFIIHLIDLVVGKIFTSLNSLILEIVVLLPFIQFILQIFFDQRSPDILFCRT